MNLWSSLLEADSAYRTSDVYLARLSTSLSDTEPIRITPDQNDIVKLYRSIHHAIDALSIPEDIPTGTRVTVFKPKYDISINTPSIDECPYINILDEVWAHGSFDVEEVGEYTIVDNRTKRHEFNGGSVVESIIAEMPYEDIIESFVDEESDGSIDDVYESILSKFVTEADGDNKEEEDDDKNTRDTMRDARKDLNDDLGDEEPLDEEQNGDIPADDEDGEDTNTDDDNTDDTENTEDPTEGDEEESDSEDSDSTDTDAGSSDDDGMDSGLDDMGDGDDAGGDDSSGTDSEGDDAGGDADSSDDTSDDSSADGDPNADKNKKINKINLLKDFISLYKTIENSNKKLTEARKDNILTSVTINQVRKNLTRLGEVVYNYILLYYDGNDHSINLYNFKYFSEILKLNVDMLRIMQNNEDNGQTNS